MDGMLIWRLRRAPLTAVLEAGFGLRVCGLARLDVGLWALDGRGLVWKLRHARWAPFWREASGCGFAGLGRQVLSSRVCGWPGAQKQTRKEKTKYRRGNESGIGGLVWTGVGSRVCGWPGFGSRDCAAVGCFWGIGLSRWLPFWREASGVACSQVWAARY